MDYPIIVIGSITYAMKGQRVLNAYNIDSRLEKTPKEFSSTGCSYCLRLTDHLDEAVEILQRNNVRIERVIR